MRASILEPWVCHVKMPLRFEFEELLESEKRQFVRRKKFQFRQLFTCALINANEKYAHTIRVSLSIAVV